MAGLKEVLVAALAGSIEQVAESKLVEVLQKLHDTDPVKWRATVISGHELCNVLLPIVDKSKTPIDDAILDALKEAIETSAKDNGLPLP